MQQATGSHEVEEVVHLCLVWFVQLGSIQSIIQKVNPTQFILRPTSNNPAHKPNTPLGSSLSDIILAQQLTSSVHACGPSSAHCSYECVRLMCNSNQLGQRQSARSMVRSSVINFGQLTCLTQFLNLILILKFVCSNFVMTCLEPLTFV